MLKAISVDINKVDFFTFVNIVTVLFTRILPGINKKEWLHLLWKQVTADGTAVNI